LIYLICSEHWRYHRELESYLIRLGAQRAILHNPLEQSLQNIVDYEDEITELIYNPRGPLWNDAGFQVKFRKKFNRDCVFLSEQYRNCLVY
jgi:hypothetical protein